MSNLLNVFSSSDYRAYLKAWIQEGKRARTATLSQVASATKVHPTFLSQVLKGGKQLSLEQAASFSELAAHTRLERDYFFLLLQLDRAGTPALRAYWLEKKQELERERSQLGRRFEEHHELSNEERVTFYSSWLYVAAWVATAIDDGQTLDQLAARFRLTRQKAEEVLEFLVGTGVCVQESGKFRMGQVHVHVPNESAFVGKHHSNWRVKALQRMDFRDREELFFTAPMSISRGDFDRLRERIHQLIEETVRVAKASPSEEVFCLNIDLFRVED